MRADAQVLAHEHAGHHNVMLPLFIRLNALVEIITPVDGAVKDLLNAETAHLIIVLQDVVKDALLD